MRLVKCPDCKKMVSERADKCPSCGCLAKFFTGMTDPQGNNEENAKENSGRNEQKAEPEETMPAEETVNRMIKFSFGRHSVTYPEKAAAYAALFGNYLHVADMAYESMVALYKQAGTIGKALETLPGKANEFIFASIDRGIKYLYSRGVYITQQEFLKKYNRTYAMDYNRYYSVTAEQYSQILDLKKELAAYREAEKASRGRWEGGGFGLKGAIKGAITASALNMGSGLLHSVGDASKERRDNEAIRQKLTALYNNSEGQLCHSVKICVMSVHKAMCDELRAINAFEEVIQLQPDKAKSIYENANKFETDKDIIKQKMLECIYLYPGERKYYSVFDDDFMNSETDIKDFLAFWHMEYLLADVIERRDTQDRQNEFASFITRKGIEDFDFNNLSAENAVTLCSWLDEYEHNIPDNGEWAKKISEYIMQFKNCRKEHKKEILIDYLPLGLKFSEFNLACKKNQQWLDVKPLDTFSFGVSGITSEKIKEFLEADGDCVQLYCDTSVSKTEPKGLAVTSRYVVDLKSHNRIQISDIKDVEVEQTDEHKFEIRFSDGAQEIRFYCDEIREHEPDAYYLRNYLKAVFVRYGNNKLLTMPSPPQPDNEKEVSVDRGVDSKKIRDMIYKNDTGTECAEQNPAVGLESQSPEKKTKDRHSPNLSNLIVKGQKMPVKTSGGRGTVDVCLGWSFNNNTPIDIKVSAFLLGTAGKVLGDSWVVFDGQAVSPDQSVSLLAGSTDDKEVIGIDLENLNPGIQKIVFAIMIDNAIEKGFHFKMMENVYIRVLDTDSKEEILSFKVEEYDSNIFSMIIGELYCHKGTWKFNAVGNGFAKEFFDLCQLYGARIGGKA